MSPLHLCRRASATIGARAARGVRQMIAPRVVMVALLAGVGGAGLHYGSQWWMVSRLAAKLPQADDRQAPEIVRELARFERRAYLQLVRGANSPRAAVALSARRQIDRCVEAWEHQVFLHPATFDLSTTAIPLAEAFARQAKEMSPSGVEWSRSVIESLAALAKSQSLRHKLALLASCDAALAALPQGDLRTALAEADRVNYDLMLGHVLHPRPPTQPRATSENGVVNSTPREDSLEGMAESTPPAGVDEEPWRSTLPGPAARDMSPVTERRQEGPSAIAASPSPPPDPEILPQVASSPNTLPRGTASGAQRAARPQPDRELFAMLCDGSPVEQTRAAERLYTLGYGQVAPSDARLLLSPSIDDRQVLVESVLTSRRLEAVTWLRLLLRDPAPQVRATVIAGISTTDNEALLQEALDVAVRDGDPRVADQAERLRDRLR